MTDKWKSGTKTWCDDCRKFFYDNAVGRRRHMESEVHIKNRERRIREMMNANKEERMLKEKALRHIDKLDRITSDKRVAMGPVGGGGQTDHMQYLKYMVQGAAPGLDLPDPTAPKYFDLNLIEMQRRRLYGAFMPDEEEKPKEEEENPPELQPFQGQQPDAPPPELTPEQEMEQRAAIRMAEIREAERRMRMTERERHHIEGFAGQFVEVNPDDLYSAWYAPEEEVNEEEKKQKEEEARMARNHKVIEEFEEERLSTRAAALSEGFNQKELTPADHLRREKVPEKPVFQALLEEEQVQEPVFKKRRLNGNLSSRRK